MLYVLKCEKCDKVEERFCPVDARHLQECEKCGSVLQVMVQAVNAVWLTDTGTCSKGKQCK